MRIFFLLACIITLSFSKAQAHPHAWIDLESTVLFNKQGQISGVRVGWLFDDFYSAFTIDGIQVTQDSLNALAETNLKNLAEYNYFTQIKADGEKATFGTVTRYHTELIGNRLWLEFDVLLDKPIDPKSQKFSYQVFDPTFYVEILHSKEGDPIRMEGAAASGCSYQLKAPEPPEEIYMMAAAMDRDTKAPDTIGAYFAEEVSLSCR